ncbi:MAG: cysteine-rich CWC family protein [Cognaticolwellia sp.]
MRSVSKKQSEIDDDFRHVTGGEVMVLSSLLMSLPTMVPMSAIDQSQCPLCQQNNLCGVNGSTPCWCVNSDIKRELLQQVPAELSGKSCVCQPCINKFNLAHAIEKA